MIFTYILVIPILFSLLDFEKVANSNELLEDLNNHLIKITSLLENIREEQKKDWIFLEPFLPSITIFISVITAFGAIWFQSWLTKRRVVKSTENLLQWMVKETRGKLIMTTSENTMSALLKKPEPIDIVFPTDTYDSMISSTYYTHLDNNTRKAFITFFNDLKIHNEEIKNLNRLREQAAIRSSPINSFQSLITEKKKYLLNLERELIKSGIEHNNMLVRKQKLYKLRKWLGRKKEETVD